MSEHPLFDTVDPVALEYATTQIGFAFMAGAVGTLNALANDDAVPPDAFHAAIVKAHLSGAAAGLLVMAGALGDDQVAADVADFVKRCMAELREQAAAADTILNPTGDTTDA